MKPGTKAYMARRGAKAAGTVVFVVGLLGLGLAIMWSRETRCGYGDETVGRRRGLGAGPPQAY